MTLLLCFLFVAIPATLMYIAWRLSGRWEKMWVGEREWKDEPYDYEES